MQHRFLSQPNICFCTPSSLGVMRHCRMMPVITNRTPQLRITRQHPCLSFCCALLDITSHTNRKRTASFCAMHVCTITLHHGRMGTSQVYVMHSVASRDMKALGLISGFDSISVDAGRKRTSSPTHLVYLCKKQLCQRLKESQSQTCLQLSV